MCVQTLVARALQRLDKRAEAAECYASVQSRRQAAGSALQPKCPVSEVLLATVLGVRQARGCKGAQAEGCQAWLRRQGTQVGDKNALVCVAVRTVGRQQPHTVVRENTYYYTICTTRCMTRDVHDLFRPCAPEDWQRAVDHAAQTLRLSHCANTNVPG